VTEDTIEHLELLAENEDVEFEALKEKFKEKYEEIQNRSEGISDEDIEELALRQTRTSALSEVRIPSDEIELLTIGGSIRNTSNGDMFFGSALADTEPENDANQTELASVTIFDSELAGQIYEAFDEVGNVVSGEFNVSEGELQNHLEVRDGDDTDFEVVRPDDRGHLYEEIRSQVPETSIVSIADNLTATTRDPETGDVYSVSSDIRRMEVDIFDGYKNPAQGNGTYTVRDQTVFDEEDIKNSDVFNAEEANENTTPGLTCWVDPNRMEYGSESVVEMFGTVSTNDRGEVSVDVDGMIPIMATDYDGFVDESNDETPDRDDVSTGSSDRMHI